jgi:hypothetical protein
VTSAPTAQRTNPPSADVENRSTSSRLRLKPRSNIATGYVDGGWWPESHDLQTELPGLVGLLADRLGSVERVSYHLGDWEDGPQKIRVDGRVVRLSGFRWQTAGTVDVLGPRNQLTLLVVPPEATSQAAQHVLDTAGGQDNADSVASLLGPVSSSRDTADLGRAERGVAG